MKTMRLLWIPVIAFALCGPVIAEEKETKQEVKRKDIDKVAKDSIESLLGKSEQAKVLFDKAYGAAVFNNVKISLGITAGGGTGVAWTMDGESRTYMKMGTAGLNLGLGGQKYQVIFLFQDEKRFTDFVNKGWEAETSANAVAGTAGANAEATFRNGMAIYQITEAGLMLQADISGTKYWQNKKLNK